MIREEKRLYFAPLEGITGYTFRRVHAQCFPGLDAYFSPFLSPNQHHAVNPKEKRDILPENNAGLLLVPQVLTNKSEYLLRTARELKVKYGYEEVNLNLGCPSKTVVSKGKGAGFLGEIQKLHTFFEEVFAEYTADGGKSLPKLSVKTRLGMEDVQEWKELVALYNEYPISELIVHPRVQKDYYKGTPHLDAFAYAVENSRHSLCYNGDINTLKDYVKLTKEFPTVRKFMMGRGLLRNPALAMEIQAYEACTEQGGNWKGYPVPTELLKKYHDRLYAGYLEQMSGDTNVLFKMKELWVYFGDLFPEQERQIKKLKKANKLVEYEKEAEEFWLTNSP